MHSKYRLNLIQLIQLYAFAIEEAVYESIITGTIYIIIKLLLYYVHFVHNLII